MEEFIDGGTEDRNREMAPKEKFSKLFDELKSCSFSGQKEKIEEMNRLIDEMNKEEFRLIYTIDLFNNINKTIEEEKLTMENAILLLNHVGYCKVLKNVWNPCFEKSSLSRRFEKMTEEEEKKKEEKNEKLLVDLCECYLLFHFDFSSELISICVPGLLKAALKKEESEENQTEVEMALLALSEMGYCEVKQELYLKEITEIVKHQEHHNLTQLAYQSAWLFLIYRFWVDNSLEEVIVNELHFGREAARELEELTRNVNWKKKEEEMGITERKAMDIILRWSRSIGNYFYFCELWNEEYVGLFSCLVDVFRASRDNHSGICEECIQLFNAVTKNRAVKLDVLLKSGAIDAALEEIQRRTLNRGMIYEFINFFQLISLRLKEKGEVKTTEEERKELKRKIFEKMVEEGYEDIIISFQKTNRFYFADDTVFIQL
ncbi:uncharacterized protein MONOS_7998 [Monocercomonoides exilis]|uniref:uncharacterized protein n=1 Tax=Monocercomonoides exilis TaxID=2049356 RepID=UPI003559899F|nr:hypothetical protein MONOS_7998 [Monocercomonoides exilis]|eukprot:MONOS_7998.1-p1 / transcript=MONOS_7998.1 / gene=MONOS_7998 / organism=Monocercomonoides_exilis_PA203 / gene_product=unspecified product / transcript_product=unspecified product / location=Mono_scaffold00290:17631-19056(+) / protein_length=432 / sequence_SO=supercontig / SO=protein_coding / is_pseudo=false